MWCIGFQKAPEEQTILGGQTLSFKNCWLPPLLVSTVFIYLSCFILQILCLKIKSLYMILLDNGLDGQAMIVSVIIESCHIGNSSSRLSSSEINLCIVLTGSMSVNVSITSGKDIVNSGQPCLNISTRDILIRLFFSILFGLLLCIFFSLT